MNEIETWLTSRIGLNFRSGLDRMRAAVGLLGHPEQAFPVIHVTGTNGKGSTIAFMRSLFVSQGRRVATFTSPHMVSIHDRICIDGRPIEDRDFIRLGRQVQVMEQELVRSQDQLSYFEILTLIALLYFKEQAVDLALIEVGIGGLLDTTNVLDGDLALITSVGLDHQETLGDSLAAIARQKAGIFKSGRPALIGPLPAEAEQVCLDQAASLALDLYIYGRDFSLEDWTFSNGFLRLPELQLGLPGRYQEENAALALEAFWLFMKQQAWPIQEDRLGPALQATAWPGRLEEAAPGIYLDGAHNLPALQRLAEFIRSQEGRRIQLLFGALKRKDYQLMLDFIQTELPALPLTVTSFDYGESLGQAEAAGLAYASDFRRFIQDFQAAQEPEDLLFVTGSLYFIAEVRAYLKG